MLVLQRGEGEKIMLRHLTTGEVITIEQLQIRRQWSRIGITAGDQWKILRAELVVQQAHTECTALPAFRPTPPVIMDPEDPSFGEDYV